MDRGQRIHVIGLSVSVIPLTGDGAAGTWEAALDPAHQRGSALDSLFEVFNETPASRSQELSIPLIITRGANIDTGLDVLDALFSSDADLEANLTVLDEPTSETERSLEIALQCGNDGQRPGALEYEGRVDPITDRKSGLRMFEDLEDISSLAAPGSTFGYEVEEMVLAYERLEMKEV